MEYEPPRDWWGVWEINRNGIRTTEGLVGSYLQYRFTISIDPDHAKCSICLNVWHDVVTAAPCLHNFCNGCFSEWMRRSEARHQHVMCPLCRTTHLLREDSQRKNNSLMKRILKAITGGCMGAPSTPEPRQDQTTSRSHRPGKESAGTARGDEETP
ncbi:hypothetical protein DY000_02029280 [Brassica cretica]|uniref:RING-type domain-containing protein n=1 Tax=Brassica cretica TaxID=69181 RepID=A0ABQ7DG65_BRACR|nr:hypothetical protein DY000_02029280 [Brassica cretica]